MSGSFAVEEPAPVGPVVEADLQHRRRLEESDEARRRRQQEQGEGEGEEEGEERPPWTVPGRKGSPPLRRSACRWTSVCVTASECGAVCPVLLAVEQSYAELDTGAPGHGGAWTSLLEKFGGVYRLLPQGPTHRRTDRLTPSRPRGPRLRLRGCGPLSCANTCPNVQVRVQLTSTQP